MKKSAGSPFPNPVQELLLKAALLNDEQALAAWKAWNEKFDFMAPMDYGSFRTLPLLYRKLSIISPEDKYLPKLKAAYRQAWYKNQQLIHRASECVAFLREQNIPTLILKGAALTLLYYRDPATRPMADIDMLIHPDHARETIRLFLLKGWKMSENEDLEYNIRYGRAVSIRDETGFELDIHWHPFFESHGDGATEFWKNAVPLEIGGQETLAMAPSDALLHVIVHGMRWNPEPPIRWIPDSLILMREMDPEAWNKFLLQAEKYRVRMQLKNALEYLVTVFDAKIPDDVLAVVERWKPDFAERFVFREHMRENAEQLPEAFFARLRYLFGVYLRQSDQEGFFYQCLGFLRFLRFRLRTKSYLAIFGYYLGRFFRKQP